MDMEPLDRALQRVQLIIRPKYGTLTEKHRTAIVEALRRTNIGQVRIDEAIILNLGIGGPGGLPITIDVWMSVGEGVAAGLLTLAITKAVAPIVKILQHELARLITVVHVDEKPPVTYTVEEPSEAMNAVEGIPADFEVTTQSESQTRIWQDGRWEHRDTTTQTFRGRAGS